MVYAVKRKKRGAYKSTVTGTRCLIIYNQLEVASDDEDSSSDRSEVHDIRRSLLNLGCSVRVLGISVVDSSLLKKIEHINPDFIFNLCESLYDISEHEMNVAGLFELMRIPYTGSPPVVLGLALDKIKSKQILQSAGIPVPAAVIAFPKKKIHLGDLKPPFIVKPTLEDGSNGITAESVVWSAEEAGERINYIHKTFHEPAMVEEYISGRELTVSVLGYERPKVVAVSEIDFTDFPEDQPSIMTYRAKWYPNSPEFEGTHIIPEAELKQSTARQVKRIALKAFTEIGCRDYARVDIRLSKDNKPYVLEVNTNPAIFPESEFHEAVKAAGMTYDEFIGEIASGALRRRETAKS